MQKTNLGEKLEKARDLFLVAAYSAVYFFWAIGAYIWDLIKSPFSKRK